MKINFNPQRLNIVLKDYTVLRDAVIFPKSENGTCSLESKEEIIKLFIDGSCELINFQTININGHFHPSNIRSYEFIENEED